MSFAENLKYLREYNELTQKELAKKSGLSPQCICSLEQGTRSPTGTTLIALAKALDATSDYLLGLEDDFGTRTAAPMGDSLSAEERKLVEDYRQLSPALKEMLQATIETWSNSTANKHMKKGSI